MASVLRYPYEALTETTDYLQLTIKQYSGTESIIESGSFGTNQNALDVSNTAAGSLKPAQLSKDGIIILPMPSNIQDTNSVSYDGDTLNGFTAFGLEAFKHLTTADYTRMLGLSNEPGSGGVSPQQQAVQGLLNKMKGSATSSGISDASTVVDYLNQQLRASAVNVFGSNVSVNSVLARSGAKILNPNMELLFNNVTLRTFRFSFKMTPRDEVESMQVKSIIRSLKKNMSAKKAGLYLETPNIFELEYRKGNKPHPFLHRFKECALSDVSVNYTGENVYATYSDGTPISIILNLTFKELVPIYDTDYEDSAFTSGLDDTYKGTEGASALAKAMDYGLASKRTSETKIGTQDNVEGVGY